MALRRPLGLQMVVRSKGRMIRAKFVSPCPFCGRGISLGKWVKLARSDEWMHPMCANYHDAGKTFKGMQLERRIAKRVREMDAQRTAEEQRSPQRDHSSDYF